MKTSNQTTGHGTSRSRGKTFFQALTFCAVLFACHRMTSFAPMAREFPDLSPLHTLQSFLVGLASDLWVATLLALLFWTADAAVAWMIPWRLSRHLAPALIVVPMFALGILIMAHQGYVEFYRTPIMAFHLMYLTDTEFLRASTTSALSPLVAANLAATVLALFASSRVADWTLRQPSRVIRWAIPAVVTVALVLHTLQIRYRVQWFVPGPLQFNPVEKIAIDLATQPMLPPPSPSDLEKFRNLRALLSKQPRSDIRSALRREFQNRINAGRKPVIAVMALETFRPSEIGVYAVTPSPVDLTPNFDRLAKNGVLFRDAWSSGTITCAGQEALWCGYPSGLYTSLMRIRTQTPFRCVPDEIAADGGLPIWIHNGQAKFDNQVSFWMRHGVERTISSQDFPAGTPGGSWGLSDLALAEIAASSIARSVASTRGEIRFVAPFILTVSNHIPWDLPSDAPPEISKLSAPGGQNEKMWRTTAYTDAAIGAFEAAAKRAGFWDDMILILASDHGNLEAGKHATATNDKETAARRQSHIALLLTGGIVESSRGNIHEITTPVGQTGVAEFIRRIALRGKDTDPASAGQGPATLTPDILAWPREWPVFSDQNDKLFVRASGKTFSKAAVSNGDVDPEVRDAFSVLKVMTDARGVSR